MLEFKEFQKIPRLSREVVITEKIDGTNAQIAIEPVAPWGDMTSFEQANGVPLIYTDVGAGLVGVYAGSRTRWITPGKQSDNYGFASWVFDNSVELAKLGPGRHYGEWWGSGINRGYGLTKGERRFSLFNVSLWGDPTSRPAIVGVVPVLARGDFNTILIENTLASLRKNGSIAASGYMNPEGIVIYHVQGNVYFKKTLENDESPKSQLEV